MIPGPWARSLGGEGMARVWQAMAILALPVVFVTDLFTMLGFAHGTFYVLLVLLAMLGGNRGVVVGVTLAGAGLTLAGMPLSPPQPPDFGFGYVLANRLVSMFGVGAAGVLALRVLRHLEDKERLQRDREAVQHELAESERRFRMLFQDVPSVAVHGCTPDGTVCYWNRAAEEIYGYSQSEALGGNLFDLIVPADVEPRIRAALQEVKDGRETIKSGELALVRKDGSHVSIFSSHVIWRLPGRPPELFCIDIDLSELRKAEATLHRGRQQLAELADAMPLIVWTADAAGRVDYFNRLLGEVTGLSGEKRTGRAAWWRTLHPDDRERTRQRWKQAVAHGRPFVTEYRLRHQDGSWQWYLARAEPTCDADGNVIKWYGTSTHVHEIKLLEARFRRMAARLTTTLESITDAFFMVDDEWKFVFLNPQAERLLERDRKSLLGRNLWSAFPEAVGSIFQQQYEYAADSGQSVSFDAWYEPLKRHFQINAYPSAEGLAVYFQDMTGQRNLENQLRQAQRLESVGQLTGGIAHDFNNLLTVILGNAETLSQRLRAGDAMRELAEMITSAARRGAELTQRLLAFARRQALEPRPVDANRLLADMESLLRRTLGEHVELEVTQAGALWPALVDPAQLESALLNLCLNARDAMPAGGRLTVETANVRLDREYCRQYGELEPGQYVMLAVSDTGTGIPAEHMERVFEPFFTTKEKGKGTGLGLSMIYGFIKQSRGHIRIYSETGLGTTVKMYLPRATGPADGSERDPADRQPPVGNETILLVEDDDLVRRYAHDQLLALGYRVIAVDNGPRALATIQARDDIDLLFTDVVMPGGMSGRDLAEAAVRHRPQLKVLYTSGYTENAIVHHGRLDPGVYLLSKPYRRADLALRIREALRQPGGPHREGTAR